jgi:hypothetical protein
MSTVLNPRAVRALSMALLALLLAGVAADCDEGGMYQGGSDSAPEYR